MTNETFYVKILVSNVNQHQQYLYTVTVDGMVWDFGRACTCNSNI